MREIGILIIDFSFPEEETSRAQHLSVALYSSSKAEGGGILDMSCDKYEVLPFHPSLGFEDAQCEKPIYYHATHLQHAARVEDPVQSDTAYKKQQ